MTITPERLDVVMVLSNLPRWKSRPRLFMETVERMLEARVRLTLVECAYGEIPHVVPDIPGVNVIRKRARTPFWGKECMANLAVHSLPDDWKYVGLIDADLHFKRKDWAEEAIYTMQHFPVIQPWTECLDMGPCGSRVIQMHKSFCYQWVHQPHTVGKRSGYGGGAFPHPGYAWCFTRQAFENLGGFVETAAFGAADHHMALALVNKADASFPKGIHPNYKKPILKWQERANKHVNGLIHYVEGAIEHSHHGSKTFRRYVERWDIPVKHQFDPYEDLKRNASGMLEFCGNKPGLIRDMHTYMVQRMEDANIV
jgi:hypothetical protein